MFRSFVNYQADADKAIPGKIRSDLYKKGSFTFEALVIVPITMAVFIAVIFITIYIHDLGTMTAVSYFAVLDQAGREEMVPDAVTGGINGLLSEKLLSSFDISSSIRVDDALSVSASASFFFPLPFARAIAGGDFNKIGVEAGISDLKERKKLLLFKVINEGIKDISGGS